MKTKFKVGDLVYVRREPSFWGVVYKIDEYIHSGLLPNVKLIKYSVKFFGEGFDREYENLEEWELERIEKKNV